MGPLYCRDCGAEVARKGHKAVATGEWQTLYTDDLTDEWVCSQTGNEHYATGAVPNPRPDRLIDEDLAAVGVEMAPLRLRMFELHREGLHRNIIENRNAAGVKGTPTHISVNVTAEWDSHIGSWDSAHVASVLMDDGTEHDDWDFDNVDHIFVEEFKLDPDDSSSYWFTLPTLEPVEDPTTKESA